MQDQNPFVNYPPDDLRALLETERDEDKLELIEKALKMWERQYQYPTGYPWRRVADDLRIIAAKILVSEINPPAQNLNYYQDSEVPEGAEGIIDSLRGLSDNDNQVKDDIPRQGERPEKDISDSGDFSAPHDPVFDAVKPRGDGVDPEGMEVEFPPTGGDIGGWPEMI
jgi:hypothetical protein